MEIIFVRKMSGMESKSVCLLLITSFIGLLSLARSDPDGFLNINCGATGNLTDENFQHWISDSPFIKTRNVSMVPSINDTVYLQYLTLAYFPNLGIKKYCYMLPVKPHRNYLVRATFALDSTTPWASFFDLIIEGIKWRSLNLSDLDTKWFYAYEIILATKSANLSLCLARNNQTEQNRFVFISSIELRPLESSMYNSTDFQKQALSLVDRLDHGTTSKLKFADDPFDRRWSWMKAAGNAVDIAVQDEQTKYLGSDLVNRPLVTVLRSAITKKLVDEMMTLVNSFVPFSDGGVYYFVLYFCNLNQTSLNQKFAAYINRIQIADYIQLNFMQCWQAEYDLELVTSDPIRITLEPSPLSELGPFINGAEMYRKLDVNKSTYSGDVVAFRKIAEAINVPDDWTGGDPCLPVDYSSTGITCSQDDPPRVIIVNLTSMRLEGNIPTNIADLTALKQLLLGNNNLSGHVPDLSLLKNLTILQLQNNRLTGGIPGSLEKLQMLSQLFLQDNKLEGTVSKGLVRPGLDLRVDPQNAIPVPIGRRQIKGSVIGIFVGCSVVLAVVILSGILIWKHKHTSQQLPSRHHISADEKNQNDYHRLAVEYTEEDIRTSTNNYSRLIGKGGFGSVYYGRLSGYDVAVKILQTDSNQGLDEFQNEVTTHTDLINRLCKEFYSYL